MKNTETETACKPMTATSPHRGKAIMATIIANSSTVLITACTLSSLLILLVTLTVNATIATKSEPSVPTATALDCQSVMPHLLFVNHRLTIIAVAALCTVLISQIHIYWLQHNRKNGS